MMKGKLNVIGKWELRSNGYQYQMILSNGEIKHLWQSCKLQLNLFMVRKRTMNWNRGQAMMKFHKKDVTATERVGNSAGVTMKFRRKDAIIAEQFDGTPEMAKKYDLLQPFADQGYLRYYLNFQAIHIGDWFVYDGGLIPRILSDETFKETYEPAKD